MLRIALREDTTRDAIDDATGEAGFLLVNILPPSATHPAQIIYTTRDRQTFLHLIEDARLRALYFVVQGPAEEAVAALLQAKLPHLSQDELSSLAPRMCG